MLILHRLSIGSLAIAFVLCAVYPACAAGTVQLEIIGSQRGAALSFQQWNETLGKAGIRNFRIRGGDENEKVGIEVGGTAQSPVYVVTAILNERDELVVPGARFRRAEAARLVEWLKDLAANGPVEGRPAKGAFGLTAEQFAALHEDLAKPVDFATKGLTRAETAERIGGKLQTPLRIAPADAQALKADKIEEELNGLASGTVLAYVLRVGGYCLTPRANGGKLELAVVPAKPKLEIWPVGWEPKTDASKAIPALYEFLNVNIQNAAVSDALKAIGERLKVPVLVDHNALARHGVDMSQTASLPSGRTTYSLALKKLLFQARLKYEVRLDEADQPFLWVSTVKAM